MRIVRLRGVPRFTPCGDLRSGSPIFSRASRSRTAAFGRARRPRWARGCDEIRAQTLQRALRLLQRAGTKLLDHYTHPDDPITPLTPRKHPQTHAQTYEQYICKPPNSQRSAFAWHRDSDWCSDGSAIRYAPYVSVWCALDDVSEENGTLYVLGADGNEKPITANAGTGVLLSDVVPHRSSPNISDQARRVWMPQFSSDRIAYKSNDAPISFAVNL